MAYDFDGSSDYLRQGTAITSIGFTMACWVNLDVINVNQGLMWLGWSVSANAYYGLRFFNSSNTFNALQRDSGGTAFADSTATATAGVWYHVAGTYNTTSLRRVYTNGSDKQENTTTIAEPGQYNRVTLGRQDDSTPTIPFNGKMAHACVYDAVLSDAEILSLASGANPLIVRPGNLVQYWPLESHTLDIIRSGTQTVGGTPAKAEGPLISLGSPIMMTSAAAAAAALKGGVFRSNLFGGQS